MKTPERSYRWKDCLYVLTCLTCGWQTGHGCWNSSLSKEGLWTKNTGLVHSAGYLASHCFRLPFLKKKKSQLHPLDSTAGMLFGNKLLWNVARKLKPWNVFILSIYTLLFLSLSCMNNVTWIKCSVTVGSVLEQKHSPTWTSDCIKWVVVVSQPDVNWAILSNCLPLLHAKSLLQGKLRPKGFVTQDIIIV